MLHIAAAFVVILLLHGARSDPSSSKTSNGAKIGTKSDVLTRRLFYAVDADDADGVRAAVEGGARINERGDGFSQGGQTALMFASLTGKTNAIRALLDLKADATLGEKDGYTPLHGAAFQGRAEAAAILLADPSVPNTFHDDGFAPIHRACWGASSGHTDTVKHFLKAGVPHDLRTKTKVAKRPVDFANNAATLDLLKSWALQPSPSSTGDVASSEFSAASEL
jgi:ankyrin repeat protein